MLQVRHVLDAGTTDVQVERLREHVVGLVVGPVHLEHPDVQIDRCATSNRRTNSPCATSGSTTAVIGTFTAFCRRRRARAVYRRPGITPICDGAFALGCFDGHLTTIEDCAAMGRTCQDGHCKQ